jgi:long-chain fatty acid transport protein
VFNNPAGMTHFSGTQAEFSALGILPGGGFNGTGQTTLTSGAVVPTGGGNGGDPVQAAVVPDFYAQTDITPDLKAGIAVTAPFGFTTNYQEGWVGRYLGLHTQVLSFDFNPNLAYRVNNWLSVGAGFSAQYLSLDASKAINQSALVGAPPNTVLPDAFTRFDGSDWGFGYNFGIMLEPRAGTSIGLTYRSEVDHDLSGKLRFRDVNPLIAAVTGNLFASGAATASADLPASASFGITQAVTPTVSVSAELQWTQWSNIKNLDIVRKSDGSIASSTPYDFRDTWFTALGVTYKPDAKWSWRAGVAWDQSPVTDGFRTVQLPDSDRYMVGLGFGYKFSEAWTADVAYSHYFLAPGSMNKSVNATDALGTSTISGSYHMHADLLAASVRYRF